DLFAAFRAERQFEVLQAAFLYHEFGRTLQLLEIVEDRQIVDAVPDDFFVAEARPRHKGVVDVEHTAVGEADDDDAVGAARENAGELLFALFERGLRQAAFRNVATDAQHAAFTVDFEEAHRDLGLQHFAVL